MQVPIERELLNNQMMAYEVHTGVFQDQQRHCAIVIRTKKGIVHYFTRRDCEIVLLQSFTEKFLRDYPIELYRYPVMRALRHFMYDISKLHFKCDEEARTILRTIVKQQAG